MKAKSNKNIKKLIGKLNKKKFEVTFCIEPEDIPDKSFFEFEDEIIKNLLFCIHTSNEEEIEISAFGYGKESKTFGLLHIFQEAVNNGDLFDSSETFEVQNNRRNNTINVLNKIIALVAGMKIEKAK